jgi:hypothetical protein
MFEAIVSFFKSLLSNANANIRCYFNSSCCNKANASEPQVKRKIARIFERWHKRAKRNDVEQTKTPWQRYTTA